MPVARYIDFNVANARVELRHIDTEQLRERAATPGDLLPGGVQQTNTQSLRHTRAAVRFVRWNDTVRQRIERGDVIQGDLRFFHRTGCSVSALRLPVEHPEVLRLF